MGATKETTVMILQSDVDVLVLRLTKPSRSALSSVHVAGFLPISRLYFHLRQTCYNETAHASSTLHYFASPTPSASAPRVHHRRTEIPPLVRSGTSTFGERIMSPAASTAKTAPLRVPWMRRRLSRARAASGTCACTGARPAAL